MRSIPEWVASVNRARSLENDSDSDESSNYFERIEVEVDVHYSEPSNESDSNQTSRDNASPKPDDDSESANTAIEPEWDIEVKSKICSWLDFLRRTSKDDKAQSIEYKQVEHKTTERTLDANKAQSQAVASQEATVSKNVFTPKIEKCESDQKHGTVFEDDIDDISFYMETKRSSSKQLKKDAILGTMRKIMAKIDTFRMRTDDGVEFFLKGCNCQHEDCDHSEYSKDSDDSDSEFDSSEDSDSGIQTISNRIINIKHDSDSSESSSESDSYLEDPEDSYIVYNSDSKCSMKPDSIDNSAIFNDDADISERSEDESNNGWNVSKTLLVAFILVGMMGCYGANKMNGERSEIHAHLIHSTKGLMTKVQRLEKEKKILLDRINELEESQGKIGKMNSQKEEMAKKIKENTERLARSENAMNDIQYYVTLVDNRLKTLQNAVESVQERVEEEIDASKSAESFIGFRLKRIQIYENDDFGPWNLNFRKSGPNMKTEEVRKVVYYPSICVQNGYLTHGKEYCAYVSFLYFDE